MSSLSVPIDAALRSEECFRAITARRLYSARRHLFGSRRWLVFRHYENLWPFADAWSATCTLASLDQSAAAASALPDFFEGLALYHRSGSSILDAAGPVGFESAVVPPLRAGGDVFFDDNTWLGLALLRHHELFPEAGALTLAQRLFDFVTSGWSSDVSWSHPGGIRWKQPLSNRSRNTCSNGPVAELAALLHEGTGDAAALEWSTRIYDWVRSALLGPGGLYFDQIAPDGTVRQDVWSYNQGTMIGAGVLLHRITGERSYLAQATETATASIRRFSLQALENQDAAFNAVYFRNLFLLDELAPEPGYRRSALDYAADMWDRHRDPRNGLFEGNGSLLNRSAPLIEINALLAGAPPHA